VEAFQRGDFESAVSKLEKAFKVLRVPSLGLWSARALEKSGKLIKASERYREVGLLEISSGQATIQRQAQADAATELAALMPRLASLTVQIDGARQDEPKVSVDGVAMASELLGERRPVDPGKHVIEATWRGQRSSQSAELKEGEAKTITLHFKATATAVAPAAAPTAPTAPMPAATSERAADDEPSPGFGTQRVVAVTVGGVGVVGVGLGAVFGLLSKSKHDEADEYCSGSACTDQRGVTAGNAAQTNGNISTVAMIVGGVGLAAGITLWATAPRRSGDAPPAQVGLGLGTLHVKGAF
jgi:hypothetical protein